MNIQEIPVQSELGQTVYALAVSIRKTERRIATGINVDADRRRLANDHMLIENGLAGSTQAVSQLQTGLRFYEHVSKAAMQAVASQPICSGFLLPDEVPAAGKRETACLLDVDENQWQAFCAGVSERGNAVFLNRSLSLQRSENPLAARAMSAILSDNAAESPSSLPDMPLLREQFQALCQHCVQNNTLVGVNFSNFPHPIITDALNEFVYRSPGERSASLSVSYADGSIARDFPLALLDKPGVPEPACAGQCLDVVLMSDRHQEIEKFATIAWFRNASVSKTRSLASSDEYCFQASLQAFAALAKSVPSCQIRLFQTGFQPAIVGFYRAFVQLKAAGEIPGITVVPQYFQSSDQYKPGKLWR